MTWSTVKGMENHIPGHPWSRSNGTASGFSEKRARKCMSVSPILSL
jgi:hypothetical protein